jgi:hypothetical protein
MEPNHHSLVFEVNYFLADLISNENGFVCSLAAAPQAVSWSSLMRDPPLNL